MTTKSPTSLRLDEEHQSILDSLVTLHDKPSDVIRRGLRMVAGAEISREDPLYPRLVTDPEIEAVIEQATQAAVEVLDTLFPKKGPEKFGISSNFQGGLKEHITAMLTGKDAARRSTTLMLTPLFADYWSLGRLPFMDRKPNQGYGLVQPAKRTKEAATYFDADRGAFVPLEQVPAGALFTSQEYALDAAFAWLRKNDISPREAGLKLCVLSWSDKEDEPLEVVAVAS